MFVVALFSIAKRKKQPSLFMMDELKKKKITHTHTHTQTLTHRALKKEILQYVATCLNITLNEISQAQKD